MRNLVLTGGPAHDFEATTRALVRMFDETGFDETGFDETGFDETGFDETGFDGTGVEDTGLTKSGAGTTIVDEPAAAFALLRSAETDGVEPFDLFTVNGLHWRMEAERYSHLRAEHAFALTPDDAAVAARFVAKGGGLLAIHTAVICFDASPVWHELCGAAWNWDCSSHAAPGPASITVTSAGRQHALTEGFDDFTVIDEVYEGLDARPGIIPLLSSRRAGCDHPLLWARDVGDGRVVTDVLGHGVESMEHPTHRTILQRCALWAQRRDPAHV